MKSRLTYQRLGSRYLSLVFFAFLFLIALGIGVYLATRPKDVLRRQTLIVASNPLIVATVDLENRQLYLITMPADFVIEAVGGFGHYTADAVWKLSFIEKKNGTLLTASLEDALAIPLKFYIGRSKNELVKITDPRKEIKEVFSFTRFPSFLARTSVTNLPILDYLRLAVAIRSLKPEKISELKVTENFTSVENLPDGSTRNVLDPAKVDILLDTSYEIEKIRKELLRIAVYNTTPQLNLGNRITRFLTRAGMLVIAVGNDSREIANCTVSARIDALQSATVHFVKDLFLCEVLETTETDRADVVVRLGKKIAERYIKH